MPPAAARNTVEKEFSLSQEEFAFIAKLVYDRAGIVLGDHKMDLVYTRLARRLRTLRLPSFADYCALLRGPDFDEELGFLINAITTNHTKFFREPHHFSHLRNTVLRDFAARCRQDAGQRLKIWSAGCSSGEEPYSTAMVVCASLPAHEAAKVKILATDLDTNMLEIGREGRYAPDGLTGVPASIKRRFTRHDAGSNRVVMAECLKSLIAFKQLNLLHAWPMKGPFDVIFCRNVMIYFDNETRRELIARYAGLLRPGGYFYLGHSESLLGQNDLFDMDSNSTYRKPA